MRKRKVTNPSGLVIGKAYRVRYLSHSEKHWREHGVLAIFVKDEDQHCQLHGEFMHTGAVFQKIKEACGRFGSRFTFELGPEIEVTPVCTDYVMEMEQKWARIVEAEPWRK